MIAVSSGSNGRWTSALRFYLSSGFGTVAGSSEPEPVSTAVPATMVSMVSLVRTNRPIARLVIAGSSVLPAARAIALASAVAPNVNDQYETENPCFAIHGMRRARMAAWSRA